MAERTRVTPSPRSFACDLATLCATTLAGLKPASLFRYQPAPGRDAADMAAAWRSARARGVTVRVLKRVPAYRGRAGLCLPPARWQDCWQTPHAGLSGGEGTPSALRTPC